MKKIITTIVALLVVSTTMAQQKEIKIQTFHLDNGMKVVLAEDHSAPKIYGTVYVHAGSKNDPEDATGVAHYFEHIMFKGTDSIGTLNWAAEKLYIDSISREYDLLHQTTDAAERNAIQHEINRLSIASSKYAIPNEMDVILAQMGGTGVNAGTSYDMTAYLNTFPSNQLSNWMDVYVERFRNPVFRLFQSELEAVYEEKNMYADGAMNGFVEQMMKEAFGEHPYGRPIVGYTEHLKNPQPSRMREFYNTYYVANNMTLILVGDLNIDQAIALARQKFGRLRSGVVPEPKKYNMPTFDTNTVKEVKLTPMKLGVILFPGTSQRDTDCSAMNLISSLLSNGTSGLLDQLSISHKLLVASHINLALEDAGVNGILYIPNFIGQSHEQAEAIVLAQIDSLCQGKFSDDMLQAAKMQLVRSRKEQLEDIYGVSGIITSLEQSGQTYEQWNRELDKLEHFTREDVMRLANKYFGGHHKIVRSKVGFPAKDRITKPDWKPIEAQNVGKKSQFAQRIETQHINPCTPQLVSFGADVKITDVNNGFKLYSVKNPANNIFNLDITYNYGSLKNSDLDRAITYFNLQGAGNQEFSRFNLELQKLGGECTLNTPSDDEVTLHIAGFEENLEAILQLCHNHVTAPTNDESQRATVADAEIATQKQTLTDAASWAYAVRSFVLYGNQSEYLNKTPLKQWKKRSGEELLSEVATIFQYDGGVTYSGNTDPQRVVQLLSEQGLVKNNPIKGDHKIKVSQRYSEPKVFVASNKKFNQSNIYFYTPSADLDFQNEAIGQMFNKYFGHDMYSIVFQEIREFRSLGYTAYANFSQDYLHRDAGSLTCFLGTQSDKTLDGIDAMMGLVNNLPDREDKFNTAKNALIQSRNSDYVGFRSLPQTVWTWQQRGYSEDPRPAITKIIENAQYSDINNFYRQYIQSRPIIIMMAGNAKRFDTKTLEKYGQVNILKQKDIFRF